MDQNKMDKFYMEMAQVTAKQSYCCKRKVGAIIVKNGCIISEGFNGTPSGFDNVCEYVVEGTDLLAAVHYMHKSVLKTKPEVLHAESNAITKCAKFGRSTLGSTLYVTCSPCFDCSKLIIQAGISRVVYLELHDSDGIELLRKAGIQVEQYNQ